MGFFNFVKNIGSKLGSVGKAVLGQGKNILKTAVGIGNKIINNPIANKVIDFATPILAMNPYGRVALAGLKGAQKGLQFGNQLLEGIDKAEEVVKSIQKVRETGDLSGLSDIAGNIKDVYERGKGLYDTGKEVRSSVIDTKKEYQKI